MWCAAWGLASSWALGDVGSISVDAVCSGEEGEVCSGEEGVCGKGESEGCLEPDGIEDEACLVGTSRPRAGHHQTAAVRGKGQGGRQRQDTPCPQEGVGWRAALVFT